MVFELPVNEQRVKPHQLVALHLIIGFVLLAFSGVALLMNRAIETNILMKTAVIAVFIFCIVLIGASIFRSRWLKKTAVNNVVRLVEFVVVILISIYFLSYAMHIPAALFAVLAALVIVSIIWERKSNAPMFITISEQGIHIPLSLKKRQLHWAEVENVILRFGTLTINTVGNHMYQWMLGDHKVDEEQFTIFCKAHIEAAKKDRKKYDW